MGRSTGRCRHGIGWTARLPHRTVASALTPTKVHHALMATERDPIEWRDDVSPAAWFCSGLHPFLQDVGSVIPEGFEAYGRLLHPVDDGHDRRRERWGDLAARNNRIVHPEMQFHWISRPVGHPPPSGYGRGDGPIWGSLPLEERAVLVETLSRYTTTPATCWFCVWEGVHPVDAGRQPGDLPPHPQVELPNRRYFLYGGSITGAMAFHQSPHLWWPEDRAWFVATEVDYAWTYVAGGRDLLDALMADDRLEVLSAQLTDKPFYDSDHLNAALESE